MANILKRAVQMIRSYSPIDPGVPLSDVVDLDLKDTARLVWEIEGRFNASYEESRYLRTYDWRRNWEFANGNQWIYWNAEIPDFVPLPIPEEMRYTENQLRGTIRQGVNMMVQGDPAYDALPLTQDWDARESTRMAKPLLLSYSREFNLGRLRVQNITDSILFGFGIRKTYYQPAGGGIDLKYLPSLDLQGNETDEPRIHSKTREPLIEPGSMRYVGKMCMESRSPWGWFPQVGREGPYLEDMEWCIDTDWVSPSWVERAFPGMTIGAEQLDKQQTMPYQLTQPGDLNWNIFGQTPNRRPPRGKVMMITYYQKPALKKGHEKGLTIRICCGEHLVTEPLQTCTEKPPYEGNLPFTVYAAEPRRGTFYPRPPASDWVEPQMRINQALSHQFTHAGLCAGPNLLTTKGDHTPDVVSFGYEKWEIPQGMNDPRWLVPPPAPPWVAQLKAEASAALDRVSMFFGATRGERSKGDPSGYYLDVLREHDQIDLQATVRDHARSHEQDGEMLLLLAKKFEPQERMLQIVGQNGRPQLVRFVKDKLRPEKVRVFVQATSMLPYLAASRQRAMTEMFEKGFFGPPGQLPPPVRRRLLQWVNLPGLFELDDVDAEDERLAERNHSLILDESMEAFPPPPDPPEQPDGQDPQAMQQYQMQMQQYQQQAQQMEQQIAQAVQDEKGFRIDPDWDPNELLPFAIRRKKEDDARTWPEDMRARFQRYVDGLKQLQSMQNAVTTKAKDAEMAKQMQLQMQMEKFKQDAQSEGRAKTHVVTEAAKAFLAPDPHELEQTKGDVQTNAKIVELAAESMFAPPPAAKAGGKER